jgi:hypothetical protein
MLANTLMITLTHPQDTAREAEFNEWYTGNHVPDVLQAPGFRDAIRCKLALTVAGDVSPYLALCHVDSDDGAAADEALTEYLATQPHRARDTAIRGCAGWEPGAVGRRGVLPQAAGSRSQRCIAAQCAQGSADHDDGPGRRHTGAGAQHVVRRARRRHRDHSGDQGRARYDLVKVRHSTISPYFAFYDLDTNDVEQVVDDLAKTMAVCPSGGIPTSPDGDPWLQVDGFAYFTVVSAHTTEFTLLPSPFASPVASVASELSSTA